MKGPKQYLGDGAFVEYDGYGLWLTAENGESVTDKVYLEPAVYAALVAYVERIKQDREPSDREIQNTYDSAFEQKCRESR